MGLYAQQARDQAEARRKATLEERKAGADIQHTTAQTAKLGEDTRQTDTRLDIERDKAEADAALARSRQDDLKTYRTDRLAQAAKEIQINEKKLKQAEDILNEKKRANMSDEAFKAQQLSAQQARDAANQVLSAERNQIMRVRAANDAGALSELRRWDRAIDVLKATRSATDVVDPQHQTMETLEQIKARVDKGEAGGIKRSGPPPAILPRDAIK